MRRIAIFMFLSVMTTISLSGQDYLGIYGNFQNFSPILADGLANSVSTVWFTPNDDTGNDPSFGQIGVSAEYTTQIYGGIIENPSPHNSMVFGGQSNNSSKILLTKKLLVPMNDVGEPQDTFYRPTEGIFDMGVSTHYAFEQYVSVEELQNQGFPTQGIYEMGTIVYTFTEPVDNPILHITGLGGFFSSEETGTTQLFSIDYAFVAGGGATSLTRLDGTPKTQLVGDTIKNIYTALEYFAGGSEGLQGDDAGSGSFLVNGTDVTAVTFNVIMIGKSPGQPYWSSKDTPIIPTPTDSAEADQKYTGDRFNTTWTLPLYRFGGSVVIDNLRNGNTAPEDGGGLPGGPYVSSSPNYEPLNAILVDEEGNVVQVVAVSSTDGTFDFTGVLGDNYKVLISTASPTVGDPAPATAVLPPNYQSTEEEFLSGGADGFPNSMTNRYLVNSANVSGINDGNLIFGISQNEELPIRLLDFRARKSGKEVDLDWTTTSEFNNDYFNVERSKNGYEFEVIGKVKGAGTTQIRQNYAFVDADPYTGMNYYRLNQFDFDGKSAYSPIRYVEFETGGGNGGDLLKMEYYPNPVVDELRVSVSKDVENHEVRLIDMSGKVIESTEYLPGMLLDMKKYKAGVYLIQLLDASGTVMSTDKVIKADL
jgi:hypothetical protein